MSNVVTLTRVLIKNNVFNFGTKKKKGKESSKGSVTGFVIAMVICALLVAIPMITLINDVLKVIDISEILISFIIPIGGITSVVFGIFSIISVFYFSNDHEQLLPLPIKSSELLMSKFFASLISEYFILFMFIFPLIFGVGIGIGASFIFFVYAIIICILMPIIPSIVMSIVIMLINKIFDFGKRKDIFMYIMTALIIVFAFAYTFGLEYFLELGINDGGTVLSGNFESLLSISKWIFPLFNSATYALLHSQEFIGLSSIITFIGVNLLMLVILYFLGEKLYIKGITKNGGVNRKHNNKKEYVYKTSKGNIFIQLVRREWLIIKRTPIFMLNVILSNLIFPLIFVLSFIFSFGSQSEILKYIEGINFNNGGILLIVIGALMFLSSASSGASSAISREGSSAWMMKTIPISLKKQIDAKVCFSSIIDAIVVITIQIPVFILFKISLDYLILINVPLLLVILINNYLLLILDLIKPRLNWKEESEAVKQNFNVFIGMIISFVISAVFIVIGIILLKKFINIYLVFTILSVVLLMTYIAINIIVKKNQLKLFSKVG